MREGRGRNERERGERREAQRVGMEEGEKEAMNKKGRRERIRGRRKRRRYMSLPTADSKSRWVLTQI